MTAAAFFISIISILVVVANFILSILDRGKKVEKETSKDLLKYQVEELKNDLKDIANDVKDVKKMLYSSKETTRDMIKDAIEEHIKLYHEKEQ